jgi:hypothetical protein
VKKKRAGIFAAENGEWSEGPNLLSSRVSFRPVSSLALRRSGVQPGDVAIPWTASRPSLRRPTMSRFSIATRERAGTVGLPVKWSDPSVPSSSAPKAMKRSERRSVPRFAAHRRASSSIPATPEALSSAPG